MTRLIHIADLHFGAEDPALVDAFVDFCTDVEPDVIVAAGDFTQAGRRREFRDAADFLSRLSAPAVGTPGNHDVPVRSVRQRFLSPWKRFDRFMRPVLAERHVAPGLQVESLVTARRAQWQPDWSLGRVGRRELAAILDRFDDSDGTTRVLTCHHPILAPGGSRGRARTARAWHAAPLIAAHCDLVLTGHLHETFTQSLSVGDHACWFVGCGTTFSHRTREEAAGFNLLTVESDAIETVHCEAGPDGRFHRGSGRLLSRSAHRTSPD
jgi:3',5'-cyclic AMP phosphodiesterase CpdA